MGRQPSSASCPQSPPPSPGVREKVFSGTCPLRAGRGFDLAPRLPTRAPSHLAPPPGTEGTARERVCRKPFPLRLGSEFLRRNPVAPGRTRGEASPGVCSVGRHLSPALGPAWEEWPVNWKVNVSALSPYRLARANPGRGQGLSSSRWACNLVKVAQCGRWSNLGLELRTLLSCYSRGVFFFFYIFVSLKVARAQTVSVPRAR